MSDKVWCRVEAGATEAHEHARQAGTRASEIDPGGELVPQDASEELLAWSAELVRSAADRTAVLLMQGYQLAAVAEDAVARAHESVADSMERRASRGGLDGEVLRSEAARHRELASKHLRNAAVTGSRLAMLLRRGQRL